MANDKRFVVKNGLQSQNIAFVDSDKSNTITANMLSSDTLSFEGQYGQLFSIADSMNGTIFSVNDVSGIPSIEVDDDGEIRFAETFGHILVGTDSSLDTSKHIVQIKGGLNADSITTDGNITVGVGSSSRINLGTTFGSNTIVRDNTYDLSIAAGISSTNALYLQSVGDVVVSIDTNDNDTTKAFYVRSNAAKSGTEVFKVTEAGAITFNNAYTFPTADGGANQVLQTNGSGTLSFATVSGGSGLDSAGVKTVVFNDNEKQFFGTGNDLEIFHNGSHSVINENGTGDLLLQVGGTTALTVKSNGMQMYSNQDLHASFGRAKVGGGFAGATDVAVFCHEDQGGHIDRTALYQDSAGKTILNARAGQHVSVRTNNFELATFDSNSITMYEDVILETGATYSPSLLLRNDGNALSVISGNTVGAGIIGMGDEDDFVLLHTPGFNYIWARKQTDDIQIITTNNNGTGQIAASFEGGVTTKCALRANNGVKLETDSAGINVTGQIDITGDIIFEGATADAHETTLTVTDPTADRTITFPDATGNVPVKLYTDITTSGNSSTTLQVSNSTPSISVAAQTYIRWVFHDVTYSSGPNAPTLAVGHTSGTVSWTGSYNYPDATTNHGAVTTTDLFVGLTTYHAPVDVVLNLWQTDTNDWVCFLHCNTNNSPYYFHGHATSVVPANIQLSSGGANNVTGFTGSLTEEFGVIS